jgi:putative transposase
MADDSMSLLETLRKVSATGEIDILREGVRLLAQAIMQAEVTELTGVAKGDRDPEHRLTHCNGYRERRWDTRVGTIPLDVPRVRDGGYLPSLLEPRRRAERALLAVIEEAYVSGVSTRRADDLVRALGITGMSKSEVSRICAGLDAEVAAFRSQPDGRGRDLPAPQPRLGHPARRNDPRRAGRRVAGRPALLPARDDGPHRRQGRG